MRRVLASAAVAACLLAPAAHAAVTYEYTGMQTITLEDMSEVVVNTSFTLTRPTYITNGTFTPDTCSSDNMSFSCGDMEFDDFENTFDVGGDFLSFGHSYDDGTTSFSGGAFYFFAPGAFAANGTYTTDGWPLNGPPIGPPDSEFACCFGSAGFATLKVSGIPDVAGVPEPASWALLIMGFGGAGAVLRRRRNRDTYVAA